MSNIYYGYKKQPKKIPATENQAFEKKQVRLWGVKKVDDKKLEEQLNKPKKNKPKKTKTTEETKETKKQPSLEIKKLKDNFFEIDLKTDDKKPKKEENKITEESQKLYDYVKKMYDTYKEIIKKVETKIEDDIKNKIKKSVIENKLRTGQYDNNELKDIEEKVKKPISILVNKNDSRIYYYQEFFDNRFKHFFYTISQAKERYRK